MYLKSTGMSLNMYQQRKMYSDDNALTDTLLYNNLNLKQENIYTYHSQSRKLLSSEVDTNRRF